MHRSSTSTSTNIKNLAIALEAFSRFPHDQQFGDAITRLLKKEFQTMQEEQYPLTISTRDSKPNQDDDIPF